MMTNKVNANTYEVILYDWVFRHDDYPAGFIKRDVTSDVESDLQFWMFYTNDTTTPINAGDLRKIGEFIAKLNTYGEENNNGKLRK